MKRKILAVLLAIILLASIGTPVLAEAAEPTEYDVWVGGIQVTSANMDNIPVKSGTVTYTPATEGEWAKLTLDNAEIESDASCLNAAILALEDLEIVVRGTNTVSATDGSDFSCAIEIFQNLKITGRDPAIDTLNASGAELGPVNTESSAISVLKDLLIKDVSVNAVGKNAMVSIGLAADTITVENAFIIAQGYLYAIDQIPTLIGCATKRVSEYYDGSYPSIYNYYHGDLTVYKFVKIAPISDEDEGTVKYPVWVGGVQVTSANMDNIPVKSGTVTYTPATEYEWAELTLDNAEIDGENLLDFGPSIWDGELPIYATVSSTEDLEIVVRGTNTVTTVDKCLYDAYGIYIHGFLDIAGQDPTTDILNSFSADLELTDYNTSIGIRSIATYMDNVTVNAVGRNVGILGCGSFFNSNVKAQGYLYAIDPIPTLIDCEIKRVSEYYDGAYPSIYDYYDDLTAYKYIEISTISDEYVHSGVKTNSEWESDGEYHWKKYCGIEDCPGITAAELEDNEALQETVSYGAHSCEWHFDNANHWQECTVCGAVTDETCHDFTYAVDSNDGAMIIESCSEENCGWSEYIRVRADDADYTGSAYAGASVEKSDNLRYSQEIEILYVGIDNPYESTTPPTESGSYLAKIEISGAAASCEFSITEDDVYYAVTTVSPKNGTLQMYSDDIYMGEFTLTRKAPGWTICGEDGLYLTVSDGELAYSETPEIWKYKKNSFVADNKYYLTADGVSTSAAEIVLKEEILCDTHDFVAVENGDGTHTLTCKNCGYSITEACEFSAWTKNNGKGTHSRTCTVCGYKETMSCVGESVCDICGGRITNGEIQRQLKGKKNK